MTEAATEYAVFDLDGTLADNEHRVPLIRGDGEPDWDTYNSRCVYDTPIQCVIDFAHFIRYRANTEIIILTGRVDSVRTATVAWLSRWNVTYDHLIMREALDRTPDAELKLRIATRRIGLKNIIFAVEDRRRVVDMWRKHGVFCFHCADGEF